MRIFACADLHGNIGIIEKLRQVKDVDLILIAGDIGGKDGFEIGFNEAVEMQKEDLKFLNTFLSTLDIPALFILGNDDWFDADGYSHYLEEPVTINDYTFIPFEMVSFTPFNTNREYSESDIAEELERLHVDGNTVIVAHAPPYGINDMLYSGECVGSTAIREFLVNNSILLWINGHIHEQYGLDYLSNTLVCNASVDHLDTVLRGYIIDLETHDYEEVEI